MRRLPVTILLATILGIAASTSFAGRFLTDWNWKDKYKGDKELPADTGWGPDILEGYESRFVTQPEAFDGPCRSTIIRKLVQDKDKDKDKKSLNAWKSGKSRKAFLYVHGFNDYFFQKEMGERYVDSGYNFYAVDLRRYGRSRLPWQYPFNVRKLDEYFADIDSALAQIRRDGNTDITLGGHSTGGLTVTYYAAKRGARVGVNRVVTNSPFYEWNFSDAMRGVAIPMVTGLGGIFPSIDVPQGHCDGYAYSLLKEYHGEWTYNTDWKMIYSPPVKSGWVRAISRGQSYIMRNGRNITVPLLVMHSSRKIDGCNWTPEFQTGDCVLNPFHIAERAEKLGQPDTRRICTIDSGIHDLILSRRAVRDATYDTIFSFIR